MCGQRVDKSRKIKEKYSEKGKDAKVAVIFQNPDKYLAFN